MLSIILAYKLETDAAVNSRSVTSEQWTDGKSKNTQYDSPIKYVVLVCLCLCGTDSNWFDDHHNNHRFRNDRCWSCRPVSSSSSSTTSTRGGSEEMGRSPKTSTEDQQVWCSYWNHFQNWPVGWRKKNYIQEKLKMRQAEHRLRMEVLELKRKFYSKHVETPEP